MFDSACYDPPQWHTARTFMESDSCDARLDSFDDLFVGAPADIEKNLRELLPAAYRRQDKSIYLQILSQIALAQAMQNNIDGAHATWIRRKGC